MRLTWKCLINTNFAFLLSARMELSSGKNPNWQALYPLVICILLFINIICWFDFQQQLKANLPLFLSWVFYCKSGWRKNTHFLSSFFSKECSELYMNALSLLYLVKTGIISRISKILGRTVLDGLGLFGVTRTTNCRV